MTYRYGGQAAQASEAAASALRLADANINPATGLATDYLNHFNEAIMLLEMVSGCPECLEDFLGWRPMSYREHFAASRFTGRDMAIAAYDAADPALRQSLDALAGSMTAVLEATRAAMSTDMPRDAAAVLAAHATAWLKPLMARAGALINGETPAADGQPAAPQAVVDVLMKT
jgi:hypothetical protein